MSKKEIIITISYYENGMPLGRLLKRLLPDVPKALFYKLIRKKKIKVNSIKCSYDTILKQGDELKFIYLERLFSKTISINKTINFSDDPCILYEDMDMIIYNKPYGIPVHSGSYYKKGIIENFPKYGLFRPSPINRIDKETSGIVVFGKSYLFTRLAKHNWKHCMKSYLAVLDNQSGIIKKGNTVIVKNNLEKNMINGYEKMIESSNGKESILRFRVLSIDKDKAFILIHLHTGRTHQIRCQFSLLGAPLIGDKKYGYKGSKKKLHLLSYRLLLAVPGFEKRIFTLLPTII